MINVGDSNISVYIGDTELTVYAGDVQIYPMNLGTLTGITIDNLTWVTDVPYTGGTATSANCSIIVTAHYDSGKTKRVTNYATISGSLVVPATTSDTRESVGTLTLTATYEGFTDSDSVIAYQEAFSDTSTPLTFVIRTDGVIKWCWSGSSSIAKTIQYSKNSGTWTSITSTSAGAEIPVVTGDIVKFKGDNEKYGDKLDSNNCNYFSTTCQYDLKGNIMSLISSTNFSTLTEFAAGTSSHFDRLFVRNTNLIDAGKLLLPAVKLGQLTYLFMFSGCTSLTTAPKSVGTSETTFTYYGIYNYTCKGMFWDCTSLTTAPELPALSLGYTCYESMFQNCTSLTTAPELPALTLINNCYSQMFKNCSSLNYIKCLATNISASSSTNGWVNGVASRGTFVKNPSMSNWSRGISGIPNNWTIEDAT